MRRRPPEGTGPPRNDGSVVRGNPAVLLVDAHPEAAGRVSDELSPVFPDFRLAVAATEADLGRELRSPVHQLAIMEYQLPWTGGLSLLRQLRAWLPGRPVIVLTGSGNEEAAVEIVKAGAADYITKSTRRYARLSRAVQDALAAAPRLPCNPTGLAGDALPIGLFRVSATGRFIAANAAALDILGYGAMDALRAVHIDEIFVEADARREWRQALLRDERLLHFEALCRRGDGSEVWLRQNTCIVRDSDGRIACCEGSVEDVTEYRDSWELLRERESVTSSLDISEWKRAEEELRASEAKFRDIFEHSPIGVQLYDAEGRLFDANPASLAIFGAESVAELQELNLFRDLGLRQPERDRLLAGETVREQIKLTAPAVPEDCGDAADEGPLYLDIVVAPVSMHGHEPRRAYLVHLRDVTVQKVTEKVLSEQERLVAVGQLAAGIAHDFNNILTVMFGSVDILRLRFDLPPEATEHLQELKRQGRRAADLIRQIMDFSHQSESRRAPLKLNAFLKEQGRMLKRVIPENIDLRIDLCDEECVVLADVTQLQQVVTNLVINARDAMLNGGVLELRLRVHSVLSTQQPLPKVRPGEWVTLSIADTGAGIPQENISRIFDPFFSTKSRGSGTGLGLSQVYGLVTRHGGSIDVESQAGVGSAFTIYLPRQTAAEGEAAAMVEAESDGRIVFGAGQRILVVEDEANIREMTCRVLSELGFIVLSAATGREALDLFREKTDQIDLVLTDAIMPEMGGVELATQLRELDTNVTIVMMTGYPLKTDRRQLRRIGISDVLTKPVMPLGIARAIRDALAL